jgi:hypothetical protein
MKPLAAALFRASPSVNHVHRRLRGSPSCKIGISVPPQVSRFAKSRFHRTPVLCKPVTNFRPSDAEIYTFNPERSDYSRELTDWGNETTATIALPHCSRGVSSAFSAFWGDRLLSGCKWTFSPSSSWVITTYTLKIGAAGNCDDRDHSFSAFQAVLRSIHWILPDFTAEQKTGMRVPLLYYSNCRRSACKQ